MLSERQLDAYRRDGVVMVENVADEAGFEPAETWRARLAEKIRASLAARAH